MAWIKKQWARLRAFEKRNRYRNNSPDFQPKKPDGRDIGTGSAQGFGGGL